MSVHAGEGFLKLQQQVGADQQVLRFFCGESDVERGQVFGTMVVSSFAAPGAVVRYFSAESTI